MGGQARRSAAKWVLAPVRTLSAAWGGGGEKAETSGSGGKPGRKYAGIEAD